MNRLIMHVTYSCKPGMAEAFVRSIKEQGLQALVQAEDGCAQYDYHLSLEAPDTVVLLENWRDAEALAAHMAQPHMAKIQALKAEYVADVQILRYEIQG